MKQSFITGIIIYVGMLRMIRETGILSFLNSLRLLIGYIMLYYW